MVRNSNQLTEKALLVTIFPKELNESDAKNHLEELHGLCKTIGFTCCGKLVVPLREILPKYYIGKGWAEEVAQQAKFLEANYIIFDDDLSPSQQKNLEALCKLPIIDRHQIIIEIFAQRAQTKEARLQVELAQLVYNLPRLKRMWTHLSRQQGGAKGTRGEGETQLETDRRIVEKRINKLKLELKQVKNQRSVLRKQREGIPVPTVAIVGYTNAGKSSLHHALTNSNSFVENKLFATLDPLTRRHRLQSGREILITDTVGFIRKLPHDLVDAFKSTLEETVLAHFLIHVLDISSPDIHQHISTTHLVLEEIGSSHKPELLVFNKCDRVSTDHTLLIRNRYPHALFISAKNGNGINELSQMLEREIQKSLCKVQVILPNNRSDIVALAHREGQVIDTKYQDKNIVLDAYLPESIVNSINEKVQEVSIRNLHDSAQTG